MIEKPKKFLPGSKTAVRKGSWTIFPTRAQLASPIRSVARRSEQIGDQRPPTRKRSARKKAVRKNLRPGKSRARKISGQKNPAPEKFPGQKNSRPRKNSRPEKNSPRRKKFPRQKNPAPEKFPPQKKFPAPEKIPGQKNPAPEKFRARKSSRQKKIPAPEKFCRIRKNLSRAEKKCRGTVFEPDSRDRGGVLY